MVLELRLLSTRYAHGNIYILPPSSGKESEPPQQGSMKKFIGENLFSPPSTMQTVTAKTYICNTVVCPSVECKRLKMLYSTDKSYFSCLCFRPLCIHTRTHNIYVLCTSRRIRRRWCFVSPDDALHGAIPIDQLAVLPCPSSAYNS